MDNNTKKKKERDQILTADIIASTVGIGTKLHQKLFEKI